MIYHLQTFKYCRNLTLFQNIIVANRPDRVDQMLKHWTSIQMWQEQILLWQEKFSASPLWLILGKASSYHNFIPLSKENKQLRYIIHGNFDIE